MDLKSLVGQGGPFHLLSAAGTSAAHGRSTRLPADTLNDRPQSGQQYTEPVGRAASPVLVIHSASDPQTGQLTIRTTAPGGRVKYRLSQLSNDPLTDQRLKLVAGQRGLALLAG